MESSTATCVVCDDAFIYLRTGKKPRTICSPECKRRRKNAARSQGLRGPAQGTCRHCRRDFTYQRRSRDRLYCTNQCKWAAERASHRAALPEALTSQCLQCGEWFTYPWQPQRRSLCSEPCQAERRRAVAAAYHLANASEKRQATRAWYRRNTERAKAYNREWERLNAERVRQRRAEWCDRNRQRLKAIKSRSARLHRDAGRLKQQRRRARLRAALTIPFTAEQLTLRLSMFAGCWICGDPDGWHVDHVKPIAKNGPHILANLRPICGGCNSRKRDIWPYLI